MDHEWKSSYSGMQLPHSKEKTIITVHSNEALVVIAVYGSKGNLLEYNYGKRS